MIEFRYVFRFESWYPLEVDSLYPKVIVDEMVRPFLANFFLNNKLPEALNASDSVEELVWEVLAILPSGKKVEAEDIVEEFEC